MSADGSTVTFRGVGAGVRRSAVERFARRIRTEVTRGWAFDCLVTSDRELRRLNREFCGKDQTTDVLSFPAGPLPEGHGSVSGLARKRVGENASVPFLGDVAVTVGRAREQAREFGHSVEEEIQILMLHGVLHLMGMDHEADGGRMARAEKRWRKRLGLPNGLIERVRA